MQQPLTFRLDQNPNGLGLRCDRDGLFLGGQALLRQDGKGNFEARPSFALRKVFDGVYRGEADWESRIRSVKLVANALNKGDIARAMMTAVLMRLPDPGGTIRIADVDGELAKAGFNPDEPRDEHGRWTADGDANAMPGAVHVPRIQLADAGMSDVPNDPVAEAAAHAAASVRHNLATATADEKMSTMEATDLGDGQLADPTFSDDPTQSPSSNWLSEIWNSIVPSAEAAPLKHGGAPVYPNVVDFVRQHYSAAQRLASRIPGATPEMVLAALGRESKYGKHWMASEHGNYGGIHFDDYAGFDSRGRAIPVQVGQRGIRPFLPGQTDTFWSGGVPVKDKSGVVHMMHQQEMAEFPQDQGFELSGQIQLSRIARFIPQGGIKIPDQFFTLLHEHGFGTTNQNYVEDTMRRQPGNWGAYWLVQSASNYVATHPN